MIPLLTYCVLLLAIGTSRVFLLAHFPHQILAGAVIGEYQGDDGMDTKAACSSEGLGSSFSIVLLNPVSACVWSIPPKCTAPLWGHVSNC